MCRGEINLARTPGISLTLLRLTNGLLKFGGLGRLRSHDLYQSLPPKQSNSYLLVVTTTKDDKTDLKIKFRLPPAEQGEMLTLFQESIYTRQPIIVINDIPSIAVLIVWWRT